MLKDEILLNPFKGAQNINATSKQKAIISNVIKEYLSDEPSASFETFASENLSLKLVKIAIEIYKAQKSFHSVIFDITGENYAKYDLPKSYSVNYVISQLSRIRKQNKDNELLQLGGYLPKELKQARRKKQVESLKTQSNESLQLTTTQAHQTISKAIKVLEKAKDSTAFELSLCLQLLSGRRFWELWQLSEFFKYSDTEILMHGVAKSKTKDFIVFPVLCSPELIIDAINELRNKIKESGVIFGSATDRNKYSSYHESTTVYKLFPELQIKTRQYGKHSKRGEPYSCRKFYAAYCLKSLRPSNETIHSYLKRILGHENDNTQRHYSNLIIN